MKNIIELLIGNLREKVEYKANRKLLKGLPKDYQYVYKTIAILHDSGCPFLTIVF
ncbi:MAG: hypothetical protein LBG43_01960 [Treponema sp.]|jgi:DNA-binding ferritin-like protein (Dps family)|nr:hypothetical protein [Treponema sp.]